ncbi:uncharacterized protein LOC112494939 [Cephus cinctus]|uniref:Uncharacterized protein LOC112494939 n=1 Tax=Cephus cinctus TaxID=211228 RepID=A0AAJ7RPB2_CEPCN|nr:uncharacterized protein LOC112494939 [Cephus cinctus]
MKRRMYHHVHAKSNKEDISRHNKEISNTINVTEPSHIIETSPNAAEIECSIAPFLVDKAERLFAPNMSNDVCEAQTQAYIPENPAKMEFAEKKKIDKYCGVHIVKVDRTVGPNNPSSIAYTKGFQGISSVRNDQEILDLGGVMLFTFKLLLKALSDSKVMKISKENRLFIFLTKIKTGLSFAAISVLFHIHRTTASRIFVILLQSLRVACHQFILWPCRDIVQNTMPEAFKQSYRDCRVIIDCTEIKLEQPSSVKNRVLIYSNYKKGFTSKVLVSCTPESLISFIAKCYGGRTSDCQITTDSEILDLLEPGDVVLLDKGFPRIQTVLDEHGKGALIVMLPFLCDSEIERPYSELPFKVTNRVAFS